MQINVPDPRRGRENLLVFARQFGQHFRDAVAHFDVTSAAITFAGMNFKMTVAYLRPCQSVDFFGSASAVDNADRNIVEKRVADFQVNLFLYLGAEAIATGFAAPEFDRSAQHLVPVGEETRHLPQRCKRTVDVRDGMAGATAADESHQSFARERVHRH